MEDKLKLNILGQEYELVRGTKEDYPKLESIDAMGLAELYSKQLIINLDASTVDDKTYDNLELFEKKVIRHEIVHAFFHESGLSKYGNDELLVEWLAQKLPNIAKLLVENDLV